jgi:hypothetical protein
MEKAFGRNHPSVEDFLNRSSIIFRTFRIETMCTPAHLMSSQIDSFKDHQSRLIPGYIEELQ